ncbi:hypothetical protein [Allorhizocola rhizosphaerae]|uniref:hypothetical protein n=1 Tax=Allorhizocola rhizosphaerae TaxID=1872709 RepID=UPI003CCC7C5D
MGGRAAWRGLRALLGAVIAQALTRAFTITALERTNFRGRTVSLAGGPALAVAASVTGALGDRRTAPAVLTAGLGSGAVGLYDDIVGARPEQKAYKGFRGHVGALREGRVTSGMVKIAGVGAAALAASALLPRRRKVDVLLGAGVIAGAANLLNLLDLRPGRALKVGVAVGAPMKEMAGPVGAAGALLRSDLDEQIMLGDSGANALGAVLGVGIAARTGTWGRLAILAGLTALTLASEKVSFTKVIADTPMLRRVDEWGRRS